MYIWLFGKIYGKTFNLNLCLTPYTKSNLRGLYTWTQKLKHKKIKPPGEHIVEYFQKLGIGKYF